MIIGISGKKRSGKDTVADILLACSKSACRIGFATALKQEVTLACNVSTSFLEEHKDSFRLILQGWGTDYRRKLYGNDFWVKKLAAAIERLQQSVSLIVVPDVRFKNEFEYMRSVGATMVRVERKGLPIDTHISECDLDNAKFDLVIENNGTIDGLKLKVMDILTKNK